MENIGQVVLACTYTTIKRPLPSNGNLLCLFECYTIVLSSVLCRLSTQKIFSPHLSERRRMFAAVLGTSSQKRRSLPVEAESPLHSSDKGTHRHTDRKEIA
jgi:hypothetical protein